MPQSTSHPPFVKVDFYPGYSYYTGDERFFFDAGRYVGLTKDGRVFVLMALPGTIWEELK